jgi:hypothetical protein
MDVLSLRLEILSLSVAAARIERDARAEWRLCSGAFAETEIPVRGCLRAGSLHYRGFAAPYPSYTSAGPAS